MRVDVIALFVVVVKDVELVEGWDNVEMDGMRAESCDGRLLLVLLNAVAAQIGVAQ